MPQTPAEFDQRFVQAASRVPTGEVFAVRVPGIPSPVYLRGGTSDINVFRQLIIWKELAFPIATPPRVIVDAGANIGLASLYFSLRFPDARIIALEAEASNYRILKLNTQSLANVTPHFRALWSGKSRLKISNPTAQPWAFIVMEAGNQQANTVESLGIVDLLDEFSLPSIDLLKMDIEGAEVEVFSANVPNWIRRVGTVAVELHDRIRPGCSESAFRAFSNGGFVSEEYGEYTIFYRHQLTAQGDIRQTRV